MEEKEITQTLVVLLKPYLEKAVQKLLKEAQDTEKNEPEFLTVDEAADLLKVSKSTKP